METIQINQSCRLAHVGKYTYTRPMVLPKNPMENDVFPTNKNWDIWIHFGVWNFHLVFGETSSTVRVVIQAIQFCFVLRYALTTTQKTSGFLVFGAGIASSVF